MENNQEKIYNAIEVSQDQEFGEPIEASMGEPNLVNKEKAVLDASFMDSFNKSQDLSVSIEENYNALPTINNKEDFFKNSMNKHYENKNIGLENSVNNKTYATKEEAEVAINKIQRDKKEIKEDYTLEEINEAKYESVKLAGRDLRDADELADYLLSDQAGQEKAAFLASEHLNDLIEKDGFVNSITSFASHALVVKPLAENLVGDASIDNVGNDIEEYQAIRDEKEKSKKAIELIDKWYKQTNNNTFTTKFFLAQLNNPFYRENLTDEVYLQTIDLVAFGGLGDILGAGKFAYKGAKKGSKAIKKGASNSYKEIVKATKTDAITNAEKVGNTKPVGYMLGDIVGKANEDPRLLEQLEQLTGMDKDTIYQLGTISSKEELDALFLSNPKLLTDYGSVEKFQAYLRSFKQAKDDIDLSYVKEKELHRKGLTRKEEIDYTVNEQEKLEAEAKALIVDYNDAYDIKTNLEMQANGDMWEAVVDGTKDKKAAELFLEKNGEKLGKEKQVIETNINAVQPFDVIVSDNRTDLIRGRSGIVSDYFLSPENTLAFGIKRDDNISSVVSDLTVIRNQQQDFLEKTKEVIKKNVKQYNTMSKKEKQLFDSIIFEGDEYIENGVNVGKTFNVMELTNKGASDKVIEAYTRYRLLADENLSVNNKIIREDMRLKGYRQYEFNLGGNVAQQLRSSRSKQYNIVDNNISLPGVKFTGRDKKIELTEQLSREYALDEFTGQVVELATLRNRIDSADLIQLVDNIGVDGNPVRFIFSSAEGKQLHEWVIHKRKGYAARKYEARHYIYYKNEYGQDQVLAAVDRLADVKVAKERAIRENAGLTEDQIFVREEGVDVSQKRLASDYDVVISNNLSFSNGIRKKELLTDAYGNRVNMKAPFEALMDQVNTTVIERPISEYRSAFLRRVKETVKQYEKREGIENILENPANVLSGLKPEFKEKYAELQKLITWTNRQMIDPSAPSFQKISAKVRQSVNVLDKKAGEVLPEKINKGISKLFRNDYIGLYDLENINVANGIKTLGFIRMLGLFNPSQLILQAMQTISITSISPVQGTKAVSDYMFWKLMGKNFRRNPDALNDIMAKTGSDRKYMDNAILDLNESNYLNSIQNNADLVLNNHGVFSPVKKAAQTITEKGMVFYDLGNEMVYSTAFFTARRELLQGANRRLTLDELGKVQERANRLAFNFTSANKSGFQEGLSSMAFQFLQVPAKAYESLFSGQFTNAEKLRLLAGQGAFLGYATVPLGEQFVGYLVNTLGISEEEVKDNYAQSIIDFENGFIGNTFSSIFGYEVGTENLALFGADIRDIPFATMIKELAEGDNMVDGATIMKEFLGPSYGTVMDGGSILAQFGHVLNTIAFDGVDEGYAEARRTMFNDSSKLVKYFSTSNKFAKALSIYETGIEKDKYGNITKRWEEDEKFGRSVGALFNLNSIETEMNYLDRLDIQKLQDGEAYVQQVANDLFSELETTGDIDRVKALFYAECNRSNLNDIYCNKIWNKVQTRRYKAALGLDLEARNKDKLIDSYKYKEDPNKELSNEYRLRQLRKSIYDNK